MPYKEISELPANVRSSLSKSLQKDWMSVFNSAYDGTCKGNDICASKIAWSVINRNRKKK